jgi:hypothetical protein
MIFDIATLKIKIQRRRSASFDFPKLFCKNFISYRSNKHSPVDFTIVIVPYDFLASSSKKFVRRQNHLYYEKNGTFIIKSRNAAACLRTGAKKMTLGIKSASTERNKTAILRAFVRLAISMCAVLKGGLPFHCSAIAFGDRAMAFSGPSGAGKTTIAKLLAKPGQLLNDDFNIILPHVKNVYAIYSTPFAKLKTLKKCVNRDAELRTIFFIEKSGANSIENLPFKNKYVFTLAQTFMFPLSDLFGKKILDNAEQLCKNVECKRLYFKNDEEIRPFLHRYAGGLK